MNTNGGCKFVHFKTPARARLQGTYVSPPFDFEIKDEMSTLSFEEVVEQDFY